MTEPRVGVVSRSRGHVEQPATARHRSAVTINYVASKSAKRRIEDAAIPWYPAPRTPRRPLCISRATVQGVTVEPSPEPRDSASLGADTRAVLQLSAAGMLTDEVAAQLGMTPEQVRQHLIRAMATLGARSKLEAVVLALRLGVIDVPDEDG